MTAGSGEPYPFNGNVYLTGPYQGAPYGLSIVVPVVAGPFNLGYEVTRSKIEVEPYSGRVVVTSTLPTIRAGIPTRLRSLTVNVNRPELPAEPDQLRAAGHRIDARPRRSARRLCLKPLPGRRLQLAGLQTAVQGGHDRQDLESQRGEP